jgi:hypothetical protein
MKGNVGAACVAASFCVMQRAPIDKAMYYDAYPQRRYCGLFYWPSERTTPCYEAFTDPTWHHTNRKDEIILLWNGEDSV